MSRTFKDKKDKYTNPYYYSYKDVYYFAGVRMYGERKHKVFLQRFGVKKKRKRSFDDSWKMYSRSPGWFTKLTMNRPLRRKFRIYLLKLNPKLLEDCDPPCHLYKKFVYYW